MSNGQAAPFFFGQAGTSSSKKKKKGKKLYYLMTPDEYTLTPDAHLPTCAIFEGLKERTTSHGIPQVDTAAGRVKRVIWIFITLATIAALIYILEEIIVKFRRRDVVVIETIYHLNQQVFPAITFCNMNPFKRTNVAQNAELSQILGTNIQNTAKKRKKRRRKRYVSTPTCGSGNAHISGYCFALAAYNNKTVEGVETSWLYRQDWYGNGCPQGWEKAVLDTPEKYNYIKDHPTLFTGSLVSDFYWLNIKYDLTKGNYWGGTADKTVTWGAWKPNNPKTHGCVFADIKNNHEWEHGNCYGKYMVLCQKQEFVPTTAGAEITTTQNPTTSDAMRTVKIDTTTPITEKGTTLQDTTTEKTTTTTKPTTEGHTSVPAIQTTLIDSTVQTNPLTTSGTTESPILSTNTASTTKLDATTLHSTVKSTLPSPALTSTNIPNPSTMLSSLHSNDQSTLSSTTIRSNTEAETSITDKILISTNKQKITTIDTEDITTTNKLDTTTKVKHITTVNDQDKTTTNKVDTTTKIKHVTTVNDQDMTTPNKLDTTTKVKHVTTVNDQDITTTNKPDITTKINQDGTTINGKDITAIITQDITSNEETTLNNKLHMTTIKLDDTTNYEEVTGITEPTKTTNKEHLLTNIPTSKNKDITSMEVAMTIETSTDHITTNRQSDVPTVNNQDTTISNEGFSTPYLKELTTINIDSITTVNDAQVSTSNNKYTETIQSELTSIQSSNRVSKQQTTNEEISIESITSPTKDVTNTPVSNSASPPTTTLVPEITTYNPPPIPPAKPVEGSQFPERIQTTEEFTQEEKTYEILANIDENIKRSLGYTVDEFIVDCQYAGYVCHARDFSYFYNAVHGNCYTFNSGWNASQPVMWSHQVGPRYGLKVVLNIIQDEYIVKFGSEAAGVRVVIHSQAKMPFPEDEGTLARTGHLTSIGVSKMSIKKQGPPYTVCFRLEEKNLTRNVYEEYYNVNYTTLACFKTCYQKYVIQECGCADPGYPSYGEAFGNVVVKACNSSNIIEDDCKYNITLMYAANKLDCYCEDPCEEDVYIPEMSEMTWPSDQATQGFINRHGYKMKTIVDSNDTSKLRSNLAKVEVYFQTFDFEEIEEKPSYTEMLFFVDIGGSMGLWIGWSLVTVFEFTEFFTDMIILALIKRKSGKVDKIDETDSPTSSRPPILPRRSLSYIHQDRHEMNTLKPPKPNLAPLTESHRDSGISSASSMEDDRISISRNRSRRASRARSGYQSRRESLRPLELKRNNHGTPTFHS